MHNGADSPATSPGRSDSIAGAHRAVISASSRAPAGIRHAAAACLWRAGLLASLTAVWLAWGAEPQLVVREDALRAIDTVELFQNGLYWWTASACSETPNLGGASYIAYSDPRLVSSTATRYTSLRGSSGGFKPGDIFDPGISIADRISGLKGVLLPECGYGAHFVRDDEAFYYAKDRQLHRKPLNALSVSPGEPIRFVAGIRLLPVGADGVLFASDQELWSYAADLAGNTLTVQRTRKRGTTTVQDVLTLPGVSLRKFGIADIQDRDGGYFGSELILLTPDGRLYRSGLSGNPRLIGTGVSDFALRNETYLSVGNLGLTVKRRATTLYIALGNAVTHQGDGRLLGLDLTPGARGEFVEHNAGAAFRITSVAVDKDRIYLTRTPQSNLAHSDLMRRNAPAETTLFNVGDPDYAVIATAREFRSLRSSGRLVYFAHGNTVQRLRADAPPIELDFEAFGIEVTQAVQNLNNTVPLVAGKRVIVRGYARLTANNTGLPAFDVPGQLRVWHAPRVDLGQAPFTEISGSPFLPLQAPLVTVAGSLGSVRTNLNATYQFEVPESVIAAGDLRFEFLLNPGRTVPETGANPLANNATSATLRARETLTLPLTMVPVQFNGGFYDHRASGSAFWDIIARARSLLPFANFRLGFRSPGLSKSVFTISGFQARSFDLPKEENEATAAVDFARVLDGNPLGGPYVGMFPPEASPWNGLGRRPGQALIIRMAGTSYSSAPWNSIQGGFNLAHEFGHNSGLRHIRNDTTCGTQIPGSSDGTYDSLPNGASPCTMGATDLNDPATAVGFDPISWSIAPPAANGDLMSYANMVWISEYNWTRLLEIYATRPNSASAPGALGLHGLAAAPVLLVQGLIDLETGSATLWPAYTLSSSMLAPAVLAELTDLPDGLPLDHPVRIQLLDRAGILLADHPVPLQLLSQGSAALLSRAVPMVEGARAVRLVNGQADLAALAISASPPDVQLNPPALVDGQLQLSWAAADADGDTLHFAILFSPDDGTTWRTLAANHPENTLAISAAELPGSPAARVRIIATDGAHSATATSEPFPLPRHAPEVRITGLTGGQQLEFGTALVVEGFGFDPEDESLGDAALRWVLTGPEPRQGIGGTFALSHLPPGSYALTLSGTDSDGQSAAQTLPFLVRALIVAESDQPTLDGLCADPGYGRTPPVRFAAAGGLYSNARFTHANGGLFVCLTGLRYGAANSSGAVAGLRVDPGGSGQVVALTAGFAVNENGEPLRVGGDGNKFVALADPPPGFSAVILRDETSWSAELRIDDSLLGGWNDRLGLLVLFDDGNAATPPATWPPVADIDQPLSWASSQAGPRTAQELIVNGSFENTQGTFVRDAFGLMSLPPASAAIPGWTTTTAELAWVDNTNTFGAATPYGRCSLELTGYHDGWPYGGLTQTIPTVPGQGYRLSLSLGSNQDYPNAGGQKSVTVCAGSSSTNFTFTPTASTGNQWETFSFGFVASSASTVVTIGGLIANGVYLGLDNVSVIADPSVTLPGTQELVVNGSFESACTFVPDANGVMALAPGSTHLPGWTTTNGELVWGINVNAFGLRSPAGSMFLDLSGYHDSPPYAGITQTLVTAPNEEYRLSFALGSDQDRTLFRGPVSVTVAVGSASSSFTFEPTETGNQWGTFSMSFRADSTATPLTITGTHSAGGHYLGLDHVSVTPLLVSEALRITIVRVSSDELTIRFSTQTGRHYSVESRSHVAAGEWFPVPGITQLATGAFLEVSLPVSASPAQQFYRVRQLP